MDAAVLSVLHLYAEVNLHEVWFSYSSKSSGLFDREDEDITVLRKSGTVRGVVEK